MASSSGTSVLRLGGALMVSLAMIGAPVMAQPAGQPPPALSSDAAGQAATQFNSEQLDALLAPVALYPDALLMQVLMAATSPLEIVAAARWLEAGDNARLQGDDLAKALAGQGWDPAVTSLVPFPQVLGMMNQKLDWTQQLGYAVATQQADVLDSVQRLRLQAQTVGTLKSTPEQVVRFEPVPDSAERVVVIEPADPQVVHVPVYDPSTAFGTWPYSTPPVVLPPPPGVTLGTALAAGLAFGAGVAVVGSLWGWATPRWYGGGGRNRGNIFVNTNRYNSISINNRNRAVITGGRWQAPVNGPGRFQGRPPVGPVGRPVRGNGLPPNAIGRPSVQVPARALDRAPIGVNRPDLGQGGINRPNTGQGGINRPGAGQGAGNRPNLGQGAATRPNVGQGAVNRPAIGQGAVNRPDGGQGGLNRANAAQTRERLQAGRAGRPPGGALGNVNEGARAQQFQRRGAESRVQNRSAARAGSVDRGQARAAAQARGQGRLR